MPKHALGWPFAEALVSHLGYSHIVPASTQGVKGFPAATAETMGSAAPAATAN